MWFRQISLAVLLEGGLKGWKGQEPREETGTAAQAGEEDPGWVVGWTGWGLLGCGGEEGTRRRQRESWNEGEWPQVLPALPLRAGANLVLG